MRRRKQSLDFFSGGDLWKEVGAIIRPAVLPMFTAAYIAGAEAAAQERRVKRQLRRVERARTKALVVDFELIAQRAELTIAEYYDAWWSTLTVRLQNVLRDAIDSALLEGGDGVDVARRIAAEFKAEGFDTATIQRIAVTETTRLMGLGAQQTYRAAGFAGWRRETANDASVCPECEADSMILHPMSVPFEPLHPNDRCWPVPEGESVEMISDDFLVEAA